MKLHEIKDICNEPLFEMANLQSSRTGIEYGIIWISSDMGKHGCRIKYFPDARKQSESLVVSIPEFKVVQDTTKNTKNTKSYIKNEVVLFAIKNSETLLKYWHTVTKLNADEMIALLDEFKKIDDSDIKKSKILKIKNTEL